MRSDADDLANLVANASRFEVIAFRGRGRFDRCEAGSLEAARLCAAQLYHGRPVGIYVVAHTIDGATERSRHVENWEPPKAAYRSKTQSQQSNEE